MTEVPSRLKQLPPAISYGLTFYAALAINFLQSILLFRILGPAAAGVWLVLYLLWDYGQHHHLGVINSLNRQIPLRMGQGRGGEIAAYTGRCAGLLAQLGVGWIVVAGIWSALSFRDHAWGAAAFTVAVLLEVWIQFHLTLMKTHSRFGRVGLVLFLRALFNLALLPMVVKYSLEGAYVRIVLMQLVGLALARYWSPLTRIRVRFSRKVADILDDGFPLLTIGILFSFQFTINKALIAWGMGEATVGREYGLAAVVLTVLMVVPGAVAVTSYPGLLQTFGATGRASSLRRRVLKQTLWVGLFSVGAGVVGWLLLPPVVHLILPAYAPGIETARWILPGVVLFAASVPSTYFLQTIRHQRQHLLVSACGLALQVALVILVMRRGGSVVQVGQVTSLAYALYAVGLFSVFLGASREQPGG